MFKFKIDIIDAVKSDAQQIYNLSQERRKNQDPETGFLISNYSQEDFENFIENPCNYFLVARKKDCTDSPILGYLFAYPYTQIQTDTENQTSVDILMKKRIDEPFVLIKQVCVSHDFSWKDKKLSWKNIKLGLKNKNLRVLFKRKKHIGLQLYNRLFSLIESGKNSVEKIDNNENPKQPAALQKCGCVAAIVNQPKNLASIRFHETNQFQWLTDITPCDENGEKEPTRSVWCRFPYTGKISLGLLDTLFLRKKTVVRYPYLKPADKKDLSNPERKDQISQLFIKSQTAASLYMHEDNLNWKKIGMLATFMAGFLTAFSYILNNKPNIETSEDAIIVALTVFFGLLINAVFYIKIQSGKMFFDSHKKSLRRYETMLYWLNPDLTPLLKGPLYRKSVTFKMISYLSQASTMLYVLCSIKLIIIGWAQWVYMIKSIF